MPKRRHARAIRRNNGGTRNEIQTVKLSEKAHLGIHCDSNGIVELIDCIADPRDYVSDNVFFIVDLPS